MYSNKTEEDTVSLLDYGGFGCIYKPYLTTELNPSTEKEEFLSKIIKKPTKHKNIDNLKTLDTIHSVDDIHTYISVVNMYNEINIGKIIAKINNYEQYFYPVIKDDIIKFNKMKQNKPNTVLECPIIEEVIDENSTKTDFINYKIKYIKHPISLMKFYTIHNISLRKKMNTLINTLDFIETALGLLRENDIVHNDLKFNNIVLNMQNMKHFMIDFGISINMKLPYLQNPIPFMKKLTSKIYGHDYNFDSYNTFQLYCLLLSTHFYINVPQQTYHCWDMYRHMISFFVNTHKLTDEDVMKGGELKTNQSTTVKNITFDLNSLSFSTSNLNTKSNTNIKSNTDEIGEDKNMINKHELNPFNKSFTTEIEELISFIYDSNVLLQIIHTDKEEFVKENINSLREIMIDGIDKTKIDNMNATIMIKMIHNIISKTWKLWDMYSFSLYNYLIFTTYIENVDYDEKHEIIEKMKILTSGNYKKKLQYIE